MQGKHLLGEEVGDAVEFRIHGMPRCLHFHKGGEVVGVEVWRIARN